ncbi:hypothetical protein Tco_1032396 [Tanacetum coccineum]|uniref:Uncharacterized protein n=1 Tax=Tanacetum coccineum TaxID=301880 RepID=A0ABQ5GD72_9ASTR
MNLSPSNSLGFFRSPPSRRYRLWEMWDCQLGNLTAGKVSGGGKGFVHRVVWVAGTSEEIDYDSPEPPKSLLKWYHYLSDEYKDNGRFWGSKSGCNESDVKPSWKDIKKAKASKKGSALVFYGPSTQGLLDAYGYNTIEEYLSWNYFPSTDNESTNMETTDKRNTFKDCIVDSNSAMSKGKYVPVCKENKPNVYSHVQVTRSVLGLPNVTTWDEIEKKMGARKSKTCADKAKGKRKVSCGS